MQFNVAQLLKEPTGSTRRHYLVADIGGIDEEITALRPLEGEIELIRTADGILVMGKLQTTVELTCDRCLEPFAATISIALQEEFRPTIDVFTGVSLHDTGEEATMVDESHIIDLTEVVRQNLLLALPMHPLCRPNCAGLCPQCGQNLNEGPCGCQRPPDDPRLAVLKELL